MCIREKMDKRPQNKQSIRVFKFLVRVASLARSWLLVGGGGGVKGLLDTLRHFWASYHVISRYITSYHVISRHITSYHVISRHITSYHVESRRYHVASRQITSNHAESRQITPNHVESRRITPYHVESRRITSYHVKSRRITHVESRRITSHYVESRRITSITSDHVKSRQITSVKIGIINVGGIIHVLSILTFRQTLHQMYISWIWDLQKINYFVTEHRTAAAAAAQPYLTEALLPSKILNDSGFFKIMIRKM